LHTSHEAGGMQMHASYFMKYFKNHSKFPISAVVSKNRYHENYLFTKNKMIPLKSEYLNSIKKIPIVFFNSGYWIEEMEDLRSLFREAVFFYRTGGNEIIKAPLKKQIPSHLKRQRYWVEVLNNTIDWMVTNSVFTEKRLEVMGLTSPFIRCVGGVHASESLYSSSRQNALPHVRIFCGARFVPYKNHLFLVDIIHQLIKESHPLSIRLAGDGPLLGLVKQKVHEAGIADCITFLGTIDNESICQEIAQSHVYMQFSSNHQTIVPGGSYIHAEGMGRCILEAITYGTFVIAGRSGALSEVITPERGVLLDLDKSPNQIVNQISYILHNLPPRGPFIETYSWENLFQRYEKLFNHV
jgi:glycosyltransferase involved in cell wall biosynthesis